MDIGPNSFSVRVAGRDVHVRGFPAACIQLCMATTLYGAVAGAVVGGVVGAVAPAAIIVGLGRAAIRFARHK